MTDELFTTIESYRREQREQREQRETWAGLLAIAVFGVVLAAVCAWVMQ